nr:hypothetical protein [Paenibacillus sp. IHB B 3415]
MQKWQVHEDFAKQVENFKALPALYRHALNELENKIDVIRTEWQVRDGFSPIEHVKSRIKEPKSIVQKMERKGHDFTLENMEQHIHDIAGMRIVCAFVKDIYRLVDHLCAREDIRVLEIKDYIAQRYCRYADRLCFCEGYLPAGGSPVRARGHPCAGN